MRVSFLKLIIFSLFVFSNSCVDLISGCPCQKKNKKRTKQDEVAKTGRRRQNSTVAKYAPKIDQITPEQLKNKVGNSCIIVNVLPEESYEKCHIADSINIPEQDVEKELKDWDKKTEIVLYCFTDFTSKLVYKKLKEMGFSCVAVLSGGMQEWAKQGYKIEGVDDLETLNEIIEEYKASK